MVNFWTADIQLVDGTKLSISGDVSLLG